jgi:hypothetical protein
MMWLNLEIVCLRHALPAAGTALLADFVSGVVHWGEDAYASKNRIRTTVPSQNCSIRYWQEWIFGLKRRPS